MLSDRFGNHVCGETSFARAGGNPRFDRPGLYLADIAFTWPSLLPGAYTLTVGIGEGTPHCQVIQCWAHNVFSLTAVNPGTVLCLFNHAMDHFRVTPLD